MRLKISLATDLGQNVAVRSLHSFSEVFVYVNFFGGEKVRTAPPPPGQRLSRGPESIALPPGKIYKLTTESVPHRGKGHGM